jgi:tetratricopeptide (TPR) repeat protein
MIHVSSWQPASADISGLRRIAVTRFEGPEQLTDELQREISGVLSLSGAYQVCDPTPIQQAMTPWQGRSPESVYAALDAARRQGLDSILVGQVHRKADYGMNLGGTYVRMGDPKFSVNLSYELIDVRTGDIRARQSLQQRFQDEVSFRASDPNSEVNILKRLTGNCIQQLVADVAPHERSSKVKLAGGGLGIASGNLRKGNLAAAKGDWVKARQEWETVLSANPDSHAAHHNLGVAAEVAGDLPAAAAAYREAERRSPKDIYSEALARVQEAAEARPLVLAQRTGGHPFTAQSTTTATLPQTTGRSRIPTVPTTWNQPPTTGPPNTARRPSPSVPPPTGSFYQPMR